jgi:GTPase SAR1 family protein
MLVYSVIDRYSFEEIIEIYAAIVRVKNPYPFACVLVGNKSDLEEDRFLLLFNCFVTTLVKSRQMKVAN